MVSIQRSHAAVALCQAARFSDRVEQQRENSLRLLSNLGGLEDVVLPRERLGAKYNYHLFPVLLRDSQERAAVIDAMWKRYVDTSTIYSHAIDECRRFGYKDGCPVSESVASRLITLPNYASLTTSEIDTVAHVFVSSLKSCRAALPSYPVVVPTSVGCDSVSKYST
jgi:dTDP-4-amino-4,6-dideoxygalactose transaminase